MKFVEQALPARWPRVLWRMLDWIWRKVETGNESEETWRPIGRCLIFTPAARRNVAGLELNSLLSETVFAASRPDLEDSIAALCIIASLSHALGNHPERDAAVDLAAEVAKRRASAPSKG